MDPGRLHLRAPSEYSCLTSVLQQVNREVIAINAATKKVAVEQAMIVVGYIVELLKKDETFCKVFNGIRHVGSYYDGLRVTAPTEFDINIVLKFPFHKKCKVERSGLPGFVQVFIEKNVPRSWSFGEIFRYSMDWTLKNIVDSDGYIRRDKVLQWWQSMFSRLVKRDVDLVIQGQTCKVTWRTSGPAITVSMKFANSEAIDIDLVPVLMFQDGDASSPSPVYQSWIRGNSNNPKQWYIVPKPLRDYDNDRIWRLSFTDQEKVIMNRLEHLKPTNKLMKRLRDNFAWKKLSSYFIKNVFIRQAHKQRASGDEQAFFRSNLGYLFIYFLSVIKVHLQGNQLPFFWDPDMNLFKQIPNETAFNHYRCLERISSKIHRLIDEGNRSYLEQYVRSLLIGGHTVCMENSPSYPVFQYSNAIGHSNHVNSYDEQHIFKTDCNRCQKIAKKIPLQAQSSCVIL
uniref:Protein MB21D1 n=1 Tax=Lygus hesperus TaxID=30085 RepID=A0A0A9YIZ2_LYGHE